MAWRRALSHVARRPQISASGAAARAGHHPIAILLNCECQHQLQAPVVDEQDVETFGDEPQRPGALPRPLVAVHLDGSRDVGHGHREERVRVRPPGNAGEGARPRRRTQAGLGEPIHESDVHGLPLCNRDDAGAAAPAAREHLDRISGQLADEQQPGGGEGHPHLDPAAPLGGNDVPVNVQQVVADHVEIGRKVGQVRSAHDLVDPGAGAQVPGDGGQAHQRPVRDEQDRIAVRLDEERAHLGARR